MPHVHEWSCFFHLRATLYGLPLTKYRRRASIPRHSTLQTKIFLHTLIVWNKILFSYKVANFQGVTIFSVGYAKCFPIIRYSLKIIQLKIHSIIQSIQSTKIYSNVCIIQSIKSTHIPLSSNSYITYIIKP